MRFNKISGKLFIMVFAICTSIMLISCKRSPHPSTQTNDSILDSTSRYQSEMIQDVIYSLSSPSDLLSAFRKKDIVYKPTLLANPSDARNYSTTASMALNMGIYSADLAYCSYFGETQNARKTFNSMQDLASGLNITSLLARGDISRVKANLDKPDSLAAIVSEFNGRVTNYFISNNRQNVLSLVSAGAFIESLYILTGSIDEYSGSPKLIKALSIQKFSFELLRDFIYQFRHLPEVAPIAADIAEIDEIYELMVAAPAASASTASSGKSIVVGGGTSDVMNENTFNLLREKVIQIRKKYIAGI